MSRNLFIVVSHGRYFRMTSKFQINFRFCRNSKVLTVGSYGFSVISSFPRFSRSRNLFLVVSQSCHVQVTSKIQVNFRFRRTGTPGYCRLGLIDFRNFFIPYVFEVKESVFRSFTLLFCSGDLENSG